MTTDESREASAREVLARWADHAPAHDHLLDDVRRELAAGGRRARAWWVGGLAAAGTAAAVLAVGVALSTGGPTRAEPPVSSASPSSTPPPSAPTPARTTYDPLTDPTLDDSSKVAFRIQRYGARQGRAHYSGLSSAHTGGVRGFRVYRASGPGTARFEAAVLEIAAQTPIEFVDRPFARAALLEAVDRLKADRSAIEDEAGVKQVTSYSPGLGGGVTLYVVGTPEPGLGRTLTDRYGVPIWVKVTLETISGWGVPR